MFKNVDYKIRCCWFWDQLTQGAQSSYSPIRERIVSPKKVIHSVSTEETTVLELEINHFSAAPAWPLWRTAAESRLERVSKYSSQL